jgi:hypothetical protein
LAQATEAVAATARRNYELTEAAVVVAVAAVVVAEEAVEAVEAVEAAGVEANIVGPIKPKFPR